MLQSPSVSPVKAAASVFSTLLFEPSTELWLIRHAEVEERYHRVFGGRIDMGLSPRGKEQAAALARYLLLTPFAAVYASPMQRVQQTLAPFLVNGTPKPVVLPGLREVDFGDWTGLNFQQIEAKYQVSVSSWLEQLEKGGIANAERLASLDARLGDCLRQVLSQHAGQRVAIACHGGVIRGLLRLLLDLPLSRMSSFEVDYASITQVEMFPSGPRVQLLNFAPWRDLPPSAPAV
jgi:broad specificity phosphatase PhoE